jgi:phosphocarrier protein FPr/phosphocarrier protein
LGEGLLLIDEGTPLVLDADGGAVEVAPEANRLVTVRNMIEARATRRAAAMASAHEEGRTADGTRIEIFANLGKLSEAAPAVLGGAEGCGLLRTEFLFLDRQRAGRGRTNRAICRDRRCP